MTNAMKTALENLKAGNGAIVVLPVATGTKLVAAGYAKKDASGGYGRAKAGYRLA